MSGTHRKKLIEVALPRDGINKDRRQTILTDAVRSALREAIGTLRLASPVVIEAWVVLPEQMHAL